LSLAKEGAAVTAELRLRSKKAEIVLLKKIDRRSGGKAIAVQGSVTAAPSFASDKAMPARFLSMPLLLVRLFHQAFQYFSSRFHAVEPLPISARF